MARVLLVAPALRAALLEMTSRMQSALPEQHPRPPRQRAPPCERSQPWWMVPRAAEREDRDPTTSTPIWKIANRYRGRLFYSCGPSASSHGDWRGRRTTLRTGPKRSPSGSDRLTQVSRTPSWTLDNMRPELHYRPHNDRLAQPAVVLAVVVVVFVP